MFDNKMKYIIPAAVLLILGGLVTFSVLQGRAHRKVWRASLNRHLSRLLEVTASLSDNGHYPSLSELELELANEAVADQVHTSSLFDTDDLYYHTGNPSLETKEIIFIVQVGESLYSIDGAGDMEVQKGSVLNNKVYQPVKKVQVEQTRPAEAGQ